MPLTGDPSRADILGMPEPSKGHERLANKGMDQLVARAIERWENEGGAVKPPGRSSRQCNPDHLSMLSVNTATGEASHDA